MQNRDIVAIGTSAGGVQALLSLAAQLPARFPASILVTIHLASHSRSSLDELLTRAGPIPAAFAKQHEVPSPGRIYIAPPARHLILDGERLVLGNGPRENNVRPAIDPMLRSVAICCGYRSVGVVLTGTQGDGASGLSALRQCSGITVVQDPQDAAFPEMPLNALGRVNPDHVAQLADMPALLADLVHQPAGKPTAIPSSLKFEVEIAKTGRSTMTDMDGIGRRSVFACPDCHGVMWEIDEGELVRFRCHVGHAYTSEMMNLAIEENVRRALASALRALEERVALAEKLRKQAADRGHRRVADHWKSRKSEFDAEADTIRNAIRRADEMVAAKAV